MGTKGDSTQRHDPALGGLDDEARAAHLAAADPRRTLWEQGYNAGLADGLSSGVYVTTGRVIELE